MLPERPPSRQTARSFGGIILAATLAAGCFHPPSNPAAAAPAVHPLGAPAPVTASARSPAGNLSPAPPPTPTPAAPHAPPGYRVGTVRALGPSNHFVLLETIYADAGSSILDGQELRCVHPNPADAGEPAALVRVAHERRPPFIVADVLSGQPQAGDAVYAVKGAPTPPPLIAAPTPR